MSIIDEFLKQHPNVRLPSPPAIAISILDETNKTEPCFSRLGEIIGSDPGLTTRVLQIANSPIIAPLTPLDNLDKALARMGLTLATNIALSFALIENFRLKPTHNFDFDYFWRRALTAAASANIISTTTKHHNDNIFISSLLQDISILGVYIACAENHEKEQPHINKISSLVEDYTGYSHAHFSTEILEQWGVPKSITQPIRFHHQPESAPKNYKNQARIINLASKLSALLNNNHKVKKTEQLQSAMERYYSLTSHQTLTVIEQASKLSTDIITQINLPSEQLEKNTIQILHEANRKLFDLSLTTNELAEQYKNEKEQIQQTSFALSNSNAELSRMAFQDSLTGLYNVRYMHEYLDRELKRVSRYNGIFSFLMFDIDDFKSINDTYGHQAGDKMLQEIATTALQTIRNTDLLARYGGEEFAVILPETTLELALEIGERLRKNIEALRVDWKNNQLSVTASIGISYYSAEEESLSKNQIIANADAGLYRSKARGKNCISLSKEQTHLPATMGNQHT